LSELLQARAEVKVVTGLPLEDWQTWHEPLRKHLMQEWRFRRNGGNWQTIVVKDAFIITQPYGSLLNMAMSETGKILTNAYSTGMVGIVDIGGNTLNLLVTNCLEEIGQWTTGDGLGLLPALDAVAHDIHARCPGIDPKTHEVAQWLAAGKFPYGSDGLDIAPFACPHLEPLVTMILNRLSEVWPEPGRFSATLLTGGGSLALGRALEAKMDGIYPEVTIAKDAQFANCKGYLKLARDLWK
jgi:plasmid segregation protein ParM